MAAPSLPPPLPPQRSLAQRLRLGCGIAIGIGALLVVAAIFETTLTKRLAPMRTASYEKCYEWNGIETGLAFRARVAPTPDGRQWIVVAFPAGQREAMHALYIGAKSELPERVVFVSGQGPIATFRTATGSTQVDLRQWAAGMPVTDRSP